MAGVIAGFMTGFMAGVKEITADGNEPLC